MKILSFLSVVLAHHTISARSDTNYTESEILEDYKKMGYEGLTPSERMKEYQEDYNWPPEADEYIPNTEGWRKIQERRFRQIALSPNPDDSYDGLRFVVHSALTSPNFTENGWGLTRAPQHIIDVLEEYLYEGLEDLKENPVYEPETDVDAELKPYFINMKDIESQIVEDLLPLHEAWSGVELEGNNAYGMRIYREGSVLDMHIDNPLTHIISSILHVGHSEDMEPWPLVIEDFHGNTNEVHLEAGDLLFYESSKCVHGRPRKMVGKDSWYTSVFTHYTPVDWEEEVDPLGVMDDRMPPIWDFHVPRVDGDPEDILNPYGTFIEPSCEHKWCSLKNSVHHHGPAPGYGKVLGPGGKITELEDIPAHDSFSPITGDEF